MKVRALSLSVLLFLPAAIGVAQESQAPTFTLLAPASCDAQPNYTCTARVNVVNWQVPPGHRLLGLQPVLAGLPCGVLFYCVWRLRAMA